MKRGNTNSGGGGPLTVEQILADPVSQVAMEEWGGEKRKPLSLTVVEKLFKDVLENSSDVHRVALLEASKYLEEYFFACLFGFCFWFCFFRYLWPHLMEGLSSDVFVLSVVAVRAFLWSSCAFHHFFFFFFVFFFFFFFFVFFVFFFFFFFFFIR
jgi:hypothetical protein